MYYSVLLFYEDLIVFYIKLDSEVMWVGNFVSL